MRESALGKFNAMAVAVAMAMGTVGFIQDVHAQTQAQLADARQYDIPAGNLADGLKQLSLKGRLQLLAPPELTTGLRGKTVSGTYTIREALDRLLEGTGLSYEFVNSSTVVVKKADKPPSSAQPSASTSKQNSSTSTPATTNLDEVTVTGTRIRGGTTPSPVVTIGSERIAEEGFSDLGEVIRSLPQNFTGGQNPGAGSGNIAGGGDVNQNLTGGSALNLRALGPDATLTLLNGRRMAYSGYVQAVDISAIPVEAVDRIEIVADGASAVYGSDAVGGVGNVILKRDYEGITVGTRFGTATDGGLNTREYTITTGTSWSSGGAIATYKNASIDPIYARQRSYTDHLPEPATLYPGSDLRSGLFSMYQYLGDTVELRLDALKTNREVLQYYNWSGNNHRVTPETTTSFISPGITISMPGDWKLSFGGTWGKDETHYYRQQTVISTGETTVPDNRCYCNEGRSYEVGAEGKLFSLPGGEARLALGAGYRKNGFVGINYSTGSSTINGDESAKYAYVEMNLPLLGPGQDVSGVHRLALTGALRAEDYQSFGGVTTPKLGLIYSPTADFSFKVSWGKSFKAPTLNQKFNSTWAELDPISYFGVSGYAVDATVLTRGGGNTDLQPERARTWSASLAFHPENISGLEMELTWFDIDYTDRVVQPITSFAQSLINPIYAPFVNYSPTEEEISNILENATAFYNFNNPANNINNIVAIVHYEFANVARQQIQGIDLSGSYQFDLGHGRLTLRGSASWLNSSQQNSPSQGFSDLAGTLFNPPKITSRIGGVWNLGGVTTSAFMNYKGGVTNSADNNKTASFTTFDAVLSYTTRKTEGIGAGMEFSLSVENLFNRAPPLYTPNTAAAAIYVPPFDQTNYSGIGRFMGITISKHF